MSLFAKLLFILALYLAFLPLIIVFKLPVLMHGSDYLMTFYPAGKLALLGRISEIYTPGNMSTFIGAPFDAFVHQTFPSIPANYVAIYMYSPLIALFFAPFALIKPELSLVAYQLLNIFVSVAVAWLFARKKLALKLQDLSLIFLFCPVFHTLLIGQLGVLFGLVPLALAYKLLLSKREFACGLALGLLYMKPQFLPCALLVCGALFFARRPQATLGLALGLALMAGLTALLVGPDMLWAFGESIKMSDSCYSFPGYKPPVHLVVCLPAVILQTFPHELREQVKIFAYGLAFLMGLATLLHCTKIWKKALSAGEGAERLYCQAAALSFLIGLFVLPLVVPHFLFYDLCGLALCGFMVWGDFWGRLEQFKLLRLRQCLFWACNIYYLLFSFAPVLILGQWFPFALVLLLSLGLLLLLKFELKTAPPVLTA